MEYKAYVILILLPLLPACLSAWWHPAGPSWQAEALGEGEVTMSIVESWEVPVIWVDAREAAEYSRDAIPGAIHLNPAHFDQQVGVFLDRWEPGVRVVVYCDGRLCGASKEVAERLGDELGLEEIFVLKGGHRP